MSDPLRKNVAISRAYLLVLTLILVSCSQTPLPETVSKPIVDPALEMELDDNGECKGYLRGEITSNTADALDDFVKRSNCHRSWIYLLSPGGDIDAAMRMGRTLRRIQAMAYVMSMRPCLSACTLVLAGGAMRAVSGNGGDAIGVHSYYRTTGPKSEAEAAQAYNDAYNKVKAYLEEMRIPALLLELS